MGWSPFLNIFETMKKSIYTCLLFLFPFFTGHFEATAGHIEVSGKVSGNWDEDTVGVIADIFVPNGESLVIFPGTVVEFQGSFVFNVEGSLQAMGHNTDSIRFQVADTTGFHVDSIPDGGWKGIRFNHNRITNEPSVFYRCRFAFGKNVSADPLTGNGGAISIRAYDGVSVDECLFVSNFASCNGGAIALDSADISIYRSTFSGNRCGLPVSPWGYGGAISSDHSSPEIHWNVFTGNASTGIGGALSVRYNDCNIYNNIFTENYSALGGALGIMHIPEISHRVNTNFFGENTALFFGGGITSIDASPVYINNTIRNNVASYGGGFYCKDSVSPDFYNCIFWGNTAAVGPQGYLFEVYSQADFFYCDVEGGPSLFGGSGGGEAFFGAFEQCIDVYPEFIHESGLSYLIQINSPCFNTGSPDTSGFFLPPTDLEYNPRIEFDIIDMGADEVYPYHVDQDMNPEKVKVWPNPFIDKVFVEFDNEKDEELMIEVFDMTGKRIFRIENASLTGKNTFRLDLKEVQGSVFLIKINDDDRMIVEKLVRISR